MQAYIYVLHFSTPLKHAKHYTGCTLNLRARLTAHACGAGSAITRALHRQGIGFTLGSLFTCCKADMRRLERSLKDHNHGPRFCRLCSGETCDRIPGTMPYPIEAIRWPVDSAGLLADPQTLITGRSPELITVRATTEADTVGPAMRFVKSLMGSERDNLGFIPAGGSEGLAITMGRGLVFLVANNGQDVGYACVTIPHNGQTVNIHQVAVCDDARLFGHGRALVEYIAQRFPLATLYAKVRDDLAANHFWRTLGFHCGRTSRHRTSANPINHYIRLPAVVTE